MSQAALPGATDPIHLVGVFEICDILQPAIRQGVRELTCRSDFPEPYADLAEGDLWLRADVEAWIKDHVEAVANLLDPDRLSTSP